MLMDGWKQDDIGKLFLVVYKDDQERIRTKKLIFKKQEYELLWFYNPLTQLTESLPTKSIERMQEVKE